MVPTGSYGGATDEEVYDGVFLPALIARGLLFHSDITEVFVARYNAVNDQYWNNWIFVSLQTLYAPSLYALLHWIETLPDSSPLSF